jgi:hypothetical protein
MTDNTHQRHNLDRNKLRDEEPVEHAGLWSAERYAEMDSKFLGQDARCPEAGPGASTGATTAAARPTLGHRHPHLPLGPASPAGPFSWHRADHPPSGVPN